MLKLASLSQVSLARGRRAALGLALILLLVWPATPRADEARYEALMESGSAAYQERDYAAAARLWAGAVAEAESFGPTDSRLAASLNSLAKARRSQARYRDSARLTQRALAIWQTTLGPEHPVHRQTVLEPAFLAQAPTLVPAPVVTDLATILEGAVDVLCPVEVPALMMALLQPVAEGAA